MSVIGRYECNQSAGSLEGSTKRGYTSLWLLAFAEEIPFGDVMLQ